MSQRKKSLICFFILFFSCVSHPSLSAHRTYDVTNLVANLPGVAAQTDPRLLNPWGLVFDSNGNLVVANNHSDLATSYAPDGTILNFAVNVVTAPTGLVKNHSHCDFLFCTLGASRLCTTANVVRPAQYLFSTEAGTILAYNPEVDPANAIVVIDRTAQDAVYKGLAIATFRGRQFIFAADFFNAQVDVFDSAFNYVFSFTDTTVPAGFAPFNVASFDNHLFVTFALQDADKEDDQPGPGNGFVDVFSTSGTLKKRLISNGNLNSPWGLELISDEFGCDKAVLLVGNFGDGRINAYSVPSGRFIETLTNASGNPIVIEGLWSIKFSRANHCNRSSSLFFTAGPNGEENGLVGVITPHRQ